VTGPDHLGRLSGARRIAHRPETHAIGAERGAARWFEPSRRVLQESRRREFAQVLVLALVKFEQGYRGQGRDAAAGQGGNCAGI